MDHVTKTRMYLLAEKKDELTRLQIRNDALVMDLLVKLANREDDHDIHGIDTQAVIETAAKLHENQQKARALAQEIREAQFV